MFIRTRSTLLVGESESVAAFPSGLPLHCPTRAERHLPPPVRPSSRSRLRPPHRAWGGPLSPDRQCPRPTGFACQRRPRHHQWSPAADVTDAAQDHHEPLDPLPLPRSTYQRRAGHRPELTPATSATTPPDCPQTDPPASGPDISAQSGRDRQRPTTVSLSPSPKADRSASRLPRNPPLPGTPISLAPPRPAQPPRRMSVRLMTGHRANQN
jgi:hypothetical protein